jgi:hypothetical protein
MGQTNAERQAAFRARRKSGETPRSSAVAATAADRLRGLVEELYLARASNSTWRQSLLEEIGRMKEQAG